MQIILLSKLDGTIVQQVKFQCHDKYAFDKISSLDDNLLLYQKYT